MKVTRRRFLAATTMGGAAVVLPTGPAGAEVRRQVAVRPTAPVRWLDGAPPARHEGTTWGVPWPRGTKRANASFALTDAGGASVPVQSWTTATWPDGSVKWTAHAVAAGGANAAAPNASAQLGSGRPVAPATPVRVTQRGDAIEVSTGAVQWRIGTSGEAILSARRGAREVLCDVALLATAQDRPAEDGAETVATRAYRGRIAAAVVEQRGPIRAVVRIEGEHVGEGREWLPFSLRLYFYAGSDAVRIVHSFIFDGDERRDFICGLGLTGGVPMRDAPYDRHVRLAGTGDGVWGEAVQPLTGLRRDPGAPFRTAQVAGVAVPPIATMARAVRDGLPYVPQWGDFTLSQPNADGFTITKRTKPGHGWIDVDTGTRAGGSGFVGGPSGGVAFGLGDFWQRCPVRLDIRDAHADLARFTLWHHSPSAPAMDLRFYHDGLGMTDHATQNKGLDITYEDYEPGWGSPHGIARTTEFTLWALDATPTREDFAAMAGMVARPPRLVTTPEHLHAAGVFGDWALPDRSTPASRAIEDQNDFLVRFYREQVEQRRWYGFWNYGDVMHNYDADRHVWRYDIGGFAWDNSELSPDLWLWYSFLRSGDAATFRQAEAMTRHTGEVDVYHLGRFRGLGTRHSVQHWGDSSKQPRVSNAMYRRIYYYLTADERVGDLMRDLLESDRALVTVDIGRKIGARSNPLEPNADETIESAPRPGEIALGFGTSWCSIVGAWLTEWERTGNPKWRNRILNGMISIAALPKGWFAAGANFDLATGRFTGPGDKVQVSHLNAVFGAVELHAELFDLFDVPAYEKTWLDYCQTFNAPNAEFTAMTGERARPRNLRVAHSRLTAFVAKHRNSPALAKRAWAEFMSGDAGLDMGITTRRIAGPAVLKPVDEAPVSTNGAAQWGLAAIQNLALIGDALDPTPKS